MNPYPTHSIKLSHILKVDILRCDSYTGGKKEVLDRGHLLLVLVLLAAVGATVRL